MEPSALFFQIGFLFLFLFLGMCLGSFATAIIHREKNRQSWFDLKGSSARSACPSCGARLRARDLVPVISWLALRGRCHHCRKPISVFYPAIEIVCGLGAVLIFLSAGLGVSLIAGLLFLPFAVSFLFLSIVARIFSLRLFLLLILVGFAAYFFQTPPI